MEIQRIGIIKNFVIIIFVIISTCLCITPKKAIIIGASSGMGREVSKLLSKDGYIVGLVARRLLFLQSLQAEINGLSYIKQIDVTTINAREQLAELIKEMGGLDLIVLVPILIIEI